jgi:hypothetical protein
MCSRKTRPAKREILKSIAEIRQLWKLEEEHCKRTQVVAYLTLDEGNLARGAHKKS